MRNTLRNLPRNLPGNLLIFVVAFGSVASLAAPAAQPGDIGLRHDIQLLADYGAVSGPVTTWPISWDALLADLELIDANDVVLPNKVIPTFERTLARARRETAKGQHGFNARISVAEKPAQIRGFSDTPRGRGEVQAGYSWLSDRFTVDLNASYISQPADGEEARVDGSQIAVDMGNWSVAASALDRWWGPGWDGSIILGNNSRPIPSLTIGRNLTKPFETQWLSWIGPWDFEVMFGQLEEERAIPNARFFGMRFNFRPVDSLEIGISRTAQWCGDDRPCGIDTFLDLLLGRDNIGDAGIGGENEPGNQMAGFDMRWTNRWFGAPVALYSQMIGEDEAGGFPSRYLAQLGIEGSGVTRGQYSYRWFAEIAGTSCDVVKSTVLYNCGYRQSIYQSGYTYRGRIIGHGLDRDALVTSLGVVVVSEEGNTWQVLGRVGELNRVGAEPDHTVAPFPQDMASIDIQHSRMTKIGVVKAGLGFERREVLATGANEHEVRFFLQWSSP